MSIDVDPLVCQICNGTGQIHFEEDRMSFNTEHHFTVPRSRACDDCRGTGMVRCYCGRQAVTFDEDGDPRCARHEPQAA